MFSLNLFQIAAAVSAPLSLLSLFGAYLFYLGMRKRERSITESIRGAGIVLPDNGRTVVKILRQFKTDENRLEALNRIFKWDNIQTVKVLDIIKNNVDPVVFIGRQSQAIQRLLIILGIFLFTFAAIGLIPFFFPSFHIQKSIKNATNNESNPPNLTKEKTDTVIENRIYPSPPREKPSKLNPSSVAKDLQTPLYPSQEVCNKALKKRNPFLDLPDKSTCAIWRECYNTLNSIENKTQEIKSIFIQITSMKGVCDKIDAVKIE